MSPRQRRIAWLGAVLCAVLCALFLALGFSVVNRTDASQVAAKAAVSIDSSRDDDKAAPTAAPSAVAGRPDRPVQPPVVIAGTTALGRPASPTEQLRNAGPVPDSLDLCGVGRVPLPRGLAASAAELGAFGGLLVLLGPLGDDAQNNARSRMLAALSASGPRGRALALLWQREATAELVALAHASNDAAVYSMVLAACQLPGASATCNALSSRAWVQMEPRNAAAWLSLAAGAEPADAGLEAEIATGLSQATVYSTHHGVLAAASLAAVPADVPAYLHLMLAIEAIGVQAALFPEAIVSALKRCKPPSPLKPDQRTECQHLAALLINANDSLTAHQIGTSLGEKLGWSAAQVDALKAQRTQISELMLGSLLKPQVMACAVVQPLLNTVRNIPRLGEMGAWRHADQAAPSPTR